MFVALATPPEVSGRSGAGRGGGRGAMPASKAADIEAIEWGGGGAAGGGGAGSRAGSASSCSNCSGGDICRICHCESDAANPLLAPCYCSGSLKYVHQSCLQQWLTASDTRSCELCKFHFIMHTKIKPFSEWRGLDMSGVERRRLCCAVLFHCVAALCVMWSLFVLIDRAAEEIQRGLIECILFWAFLYQKLSKMPKCFTTDFILDNLLNTIFEPFCICFSYKWLQFAEKVIQKYQRFSQMLEYVTAWPFWTKLVVVAVGFTGGAVFMYIQCRQYFTLCSRWRCHNRILLIQNAPEKVHITPPSPVIHHLSVGTSNGRNRREAMHDADRASHGQVVANIESNPCVNNPVNAALPTMRQIVNEQSCGLENRCHASAVFLPSSSLYVEEEDESGGFNDYRPNSFRRILKSENTNYSVIPPPDRDIKIDRSQEPVDIRRYSDTRLLQTFDSRHVLGLKMMDNVPHIYQMDRKFAISQHQSKQPDATSHSEECITDSSTLYPLYNKAVYHISDSFDPNVNVQSHYEGHPQVSDVVFDANSHDYDPLELNIQEMLELDVKTAQQRKKSVLSLNRDQPVLCHKVNIYEGNRSVFKSLPNLSASSESLLPHKASS